MSKEIREVVLSAIDSEAFYEGYFPDIEFGVDGQSIENVLCPFHDGVSLSINKDDGWFCWGCEKKGDLISFYRHTQKKPMTDKQAIRKLYSRYVHPIPNAKEWRLWHKDLLKTPPKLRELNDKRGFNLKVIVRENIGYDKQDQSFTVPIMGPHGFYHDVRKVRIGLPPELAGHKNKPYDYRTSKTKKANGEKTNGLGGRLYPFRNVLCETVILCEGEFDCILLNSMGFAALTTGGCTSWKKWYHTLKGKHIIICFDNDDPRKSGKNAGQAAAKKVGDDLFTLSKSVKNIVLPIYGDVTDYFMEGRTKEDFQDLLDSVEGGENQEAAVIETVEEAKDIIVLDSISDISATEYYGKYVEVVTQIVGEGKKEYSIVTDYRLECDMSNGDKCSTCIMMACNGKKNGVVEPYDEGNKFLSYIDMKDKDVLADIAESNGAPAKCPMIVLHRGSVGTVQKVIVAPSIKRTRIKKSETGPAVFNMTGSLELNQEYVLRGKVIHNPKDQTHCLLVDHSEMVQSSITNFRQMPKDELADVKTKFNPETKHPKDIVAKFDEIMEIHTNVTNIYGRRDLHSFIDLTLHSPLQFIFDGVLESGYVETVVIGDTDTGKNKVLDNLCEFYGAGIVVDSGACTKVGLIGGVNKAGEFSWGLIPRQHGKFLGFDEGKQMRETIKALKAAREGRVDYFTAEGKRQTTSLSRKAVLANDPRGVLSSNPFGIMSLPALFEEEADISRFTLACFLHKEEVDTDLINQLNPPAIETTITQDDFRKVLANAWTIPPDAVQFTKKATAEIYKQAKRASAKYSDTVPLVQAATQWKKIARAAASVAARLFNMNKDGTELIVCSNYVKAAIKIIERHYDSEECGYNQFSTQERERSIIVSKKVVMDKIFTREIQEEDGDVDYSIKQLLAVREFDSAAFTDFFMCFKTTHTGSEGLKVLLRNNCITRDKQRNYIKTKSFTKFLKELQHDRRNEENKEEEKEVTKKRTLSEGERRAKASAEEGRSNKAR